MTRFRSSGWIVDFYFLERVEELSDLDGCSCEEIIF